MDGLDNNNEDDDVDISYSPTDSSPPPPSPPWSSSSSSSGRYGTLRKVRTHPIIENWKLKMQFKFNYSNTHTYTYTTLIKTLKAPACELLSSWYIIHPPSFYSERRAGQSEAHVQYSSWTKLFTSVMTLCPIVVSSSLYLFGPFDCGESEEENSDEMSQSWTLPYPCSRRFKRWFLLPCLFTHIRVKAKTLWRRRRGISLRGWQLISPTRTLQQQVPD